MNPRAAEITRCICDFVAKHARPFSFIENADMLIFLYKNCVHLKKKKLERAHAKP